jgi:hypothetical protein
MRRQVRCGTPGREAWQGSVSLHLPRFIIPKMRGGPNRFLRRFGLDLEAVAFRELAVRSTLQRLQSVDRTKLREPTTCDVYVSHKQGYRL